MALKYKQREEIVGKRFICVQNPSSAPTKSQTKRGSHGKPALDDQSQWHWKRGTVRAATHHDASNPDLSVRIIAIDSRPNTPSLVQTVHSYLF